MSWIPLNVSERRFLEASKSKLESAMPKKPEPITRVKQTREVALHRVSNHWREPVVGKGQCRSGRAMHHWLMPAVGTRHDWSHFHAFVLALTDQTRQKLLSFRCRYFFPFPYRIRPGLEPIC